MKKTIRSILLLLFAVLMSVSFTACQGTEESAYEPESAIALWEKVDETMNTLESMEMTVSINAAYYSMGYQFTLTGESNILTCQDTHYTANTVVVSCEELSMAQTTQTVEAYYDGMMYSAVSDGTYDQKLRSAMTHEEYDQMQSGELTEEIDVADCTAAEYAKDENGGWTLNFSGYTKKTVDRALKTLNLTEEVLGAPVEDMTVNLTANSDFYVEKLEIGFRFSAEEEEVTPEFSVVAEYSGYNATVFDPVRLKAEEYTTVADVRILGAVADALAERQEASAGKFTLQLTTTEQLQGQVRTSRETDTVTYGRKNGAYFYDITAEMDDNSFLLQYQGGEQKVTSNGQTHTAEQTEQEAKEFIDGLINYADYNPAVITGIQQQEEGVYLLTSGAPDLSKYAPIFAASGIELTSATQQVTVTFREGKCTTIACQLTLSGVYAGEPMSMVSDSVVTFVDTDENQAM